MSRNFDNLKKLFQEMQDRYGPNDEIVLQLKQALDSREAIESRHPWRFAPYRERRSGRGTERDRTVVKVR